MHSESTPRMAYARIRFYAELNDFLTADRRFTDSRPEFRKSVPVAEVIEAAGVPCAEVDLVLVNGESVDFRHQLHDGDRVSVYPVFESLDISRVVKIPSRPLRRPRFVLDVHLGRLAAGLRMLGFDSLYRSDFSDGELIRVAVKEKRVLLSRDRELVRDDEVTRGFLVQASDPEQQLCDVLLRFDLSDFSFALTRCMRCNTLLQRIDKETVLDRLPERVRASFDEFQVCVRCERLYWKGSHYERMQTFILHIKERIATSRR